MTAGVGIVHPDALRRPGSPPASRSAATTRLSHPPIAPFRSHRHDPAPGRRARRRRRGPDGRAARGRSAAPRALAGGTRSRRRAPRRRLAQPRRAARGRTAAGRERGRAHRRRHRPRARRARARLRRGRRNRGGATGLGAARLRRHELQLDERRRARVGERRTAARTGEVLPPDTDAVELAPRATNVVDADTLLGELDDPALAVLDVRGAAEYAGTDVRAAMGGRVPAPSTSNGHGCSTATGGCSTTTRSASASRRPASPPGNAPSSTARPISARRSPTSRFATWGTRACARSTAPGRSGATGRTCRRRAVEGLPAARQPGLRSTDACEPSPASLR